VSEREPTFSHFKLTFSDPLGKYKARMRGKLLHCKRTSEYRAVERTFAWLNRFRWLRVRYEKRADIHEALLSLTCAFLWWNVLDRQGTWAMGRITVRVTERRAEVIKSVSALGIRGVTSVDKSRNRDTDSGGQIGPELRRSCR
jgi:hypothetical protein